MFAATFATPPALDEIARLLLDTASAHAPRAIAIDGVDGVGKTTFADLLAAHLRSHGQVVHRISIDDFHFMRAHRYRRGRTDPIGYVEDSFDHAAFARLVLDPLLEAAPRRVQPRLHDVATDEYLDAQHVVVDDGDLVLVDGVFLQSPQLRERWDLVVFLDAPFEATVARAIDRDETHSRHDRARAEQLARERYVPGQLHYLATCSPREWAHVLVDATDPAHAHVVRMPTERNT